MKFLTATDRYIAKLIFYPLLATLVIAAMLLVLEKMLRLFDFVATEGGPVSVVWRMLANLLPEYLSLGIPIGLLLGILIAFRRLALSSELDVMRSVGQSYTRLLRVPFLYALVLAAVNFAIVGYAQPLARYAYEGLRFELRSGALGASIKIGEFNRLGDRVTLRIEESREEGTRLDGIFLRAQASDGASYTATAASGQFFASADPDTLVLRLTKGTLVHDDARFATPRTLQFTSHDIPVDLPKIEEFRGRGDADRELTLPELVRIGGDDQLPRDVRLNGRANFHFRMVEVVSMFLLPLLALALAIPPKRSTSSLGIFLSIVFVVTFHKINEYGEALGSSGDVDPIIAGWTPFALFAGLVGWMYYTIAFVPGGQPIGVLERGASRLVAAIRAPFAPRREVAA